MPPDQTPCHFLNLPRELRDLIYGHLCTSNTVLIDDYSRTTPKTIALALTCKQIFREIREFSYIHTTFQFVSKDTALHFLQKMPVRYRKLIQRIRYVTRFAKRSDAVAELGRFQRMLERNGEKIRESVIWAGTKPSQSMPTRWVCSVEKGRGRRYIYVKAARRHGGYA